VQKVQQAKQSAMEQMAAMDPTANVLMKTQMAETQRKTQEAVQRLQLENQRDQQNYQLKVAELEQQVAELMTKYRTQSQIDSQKNATNIAMANINNASRERIAAMQVGSELDGMQRQLEHEQAMSAIDAINTADADIRKHGIAVEQEAFRQQAAAVQAAIDAQQQPPQGAI
jgi:hypothetical protein